LGESRLISPACGTYTLTITARNNIGTATQSLTITVT
jgi:hypothetical protein